MPRIAYKEMSLSVASLDIIAQANAIITDYRAQGFDLTLRQLYYQFVARDIIPNTETSYKRLGEIISNGRLCGLIDWLAIEDRTRNLRSISHWESPAEIVRAVADQYRRDKWEGQDHYVEVWVEKDALAGVVGQAANRLDVPYFACRGYVSQSEMWVAAQRLIANARAGREPVIIHLGDHDPSGVDMTRDILDRMALFFEHEGLDAPEVSRIALNMDQVRLYDPPPNPAKVTDSRAGGYISRFGSSSWELDALNPRVLSELIDSAVREYLDVERWNEERGRELQERGQLQQVSVKWGQVPALVRGRGALEVLRDIEFTGGLQGEECCPCCLGTRPEGHSEDCELALIIHGTGAEDVMAADDEEEDYD